jgi:hypothetical protein
MEHDRPLLARAPITVPGLLGLLVIIIELARATG